MKSKSSKFRVIVTIEANKYNLQFLGCWGGPWKSTPTDIEAGHEKEFTLNDNDRGGIWYRAINPATQEEEGFVTMSFTCPELSSNSAEGSPGGIGSLISAGLQPYKESGHPLNITYKVGTKNLACWGSGSSNDHILRCDQTTFKNKRLAIHIENPNSYKLRLGGYWNDNNKGADNWYWAPNANDMPPPNCKRTIFLKRRGKAGLHLRVLSQLSASTNDFTELGFANLSFYTPRAEGSPTIHEEGLVSAGLQVYHGTDSPYPHLTYKIGDYNEACWTNSSEDNFETVCKQTTFKDKRALIIVNNKTPETLTFRDFWNDNSDGASNWYVVPDTSDTIPPACTRFFVLKDNDRAGLYFEQSWIQYHLSFTCPKLTSNSAEGSPHAGLQTYSEHGTPVTFTYHIGTPNLACWSSGTSNKGRVVCKQTLVRPLHLRRWMGKLNEEYPDKFKNLTLRELYIPGAHDAAGYDFTPIVSYWAQTQDSDFYNQLILGVRYMDLRPNYIPVDPLDDEPPFTPTNYFHHDVIRTGSKLQDLTTQIAQFYKEDWVNRSKEIIILDFTHFENYSTQAQWEFFFKTILDSDLNEYLIPQGTFGPSSTLDSLWSASKTQRVIASVSPDAYTPYKAMLDPKPNIWDGEDLFAPGWRRTKFWPEKNSEQDLVDYIDANIDTFHDNANLWALQAILTGTVSQGVYSLVDQARDALYRQGQRWKSKTNIVITDFYDERTTLEAIMENIERALNDKINTEL